MLTMVWTVTYRVDSKTAQCEVKKYTEEAANSFAEAITEIGGVAVITEDIEEPSSADEPSMPTHSSLNWDDK